MSTAEASRRKFLIAAAVARMLSTSEKAIRLLVLRRKIPHFKVQGRVLFDEGEIINWIERGRRTGLDEVNVTEERPA